MRVIARRNMRFEQAEVTVTNAEDLRELNEALEALPDSAWVAQEVELSLIDVVSECEHGACSLEAHSEEIREGMEYEPKRIENYVQAIGAFVPHGE